MPIEIEAARKSFPRHYPFLDGIRGIAILWVFLFHAFGASYGWNHFPWHGLFRSFDEPRGLILLFPLSLGALGVAIFFAVSGFCIHLSHLRNREQGWPYFFWRRFFRIYPAYLAAIIIFFFLWPWHHYSLHSPTALRSFLAHLISVHNLYLHTKFTINPSMWSIGAELQLYAVYPLLLLIMSKFGWRHGLIAMLGFELLCKIIGFSIADEKQSPQLFALLNSPFSYWFSWAVGAYVAEKVVNGRCESFKHLKFRWLILLNLAAFLLAPLAFIAFPLVALTTAVAIDRCIFNRWQFNNFTLGRAVWKHLTWLGIISYSVYLVHQPILTQAANVFSKLSLHQHFPVALIACWLFLYSFILILSYGLYRSVELPFNSLGSILWRRTKERLSMQAN